MIHLRCLQSPHICVLEKQTNRSLIKVVLGRIPYVIFRPVATPCESAPPDLWHAPSRRREAKARVILEPHFASSITQAAYQAHKINIICSKSSSFAKSHYNELRSHSGISNRTRIDLTSSWTTLNPSPRTESNSPILV